MSFLTTLIIILIMGIGGIITCHKAETGTCKEEITNSYKED